jgi:hypothetical protein
LPPPDTQEHDIQLACRNALPTGTKSTVVGRPLRKSGFANADRMKPLTGEILRGSLIERTVRHSRGCTICAGGGGHPLWVLTIG